MRNFTTSRLAVLVWLSLLITSLTEAKAQVTPVNPQAAAQLQTKLDQLITTFNVKGLSASVIIPGKGTWNGVSGISHAGVPIDTAMVFSMASITHNFTAAAILLLQQDTLLSLSDSLHNFLPAYPNINPNITIRQLLQHTSGIYDYYANPNWFNLINSNPSQVITPNFVLNNFVNAPVSAPGTMHFYSHTNYLLLGLIIEQVSGLTYTSFIRHRLLNPLLLNSIFAMEHEPPRGVIPHHWSPASPSVPGTDLSAIPLTAILGTSAADVALFGSAYDQARWGQLLFTGPVLNPTSLQLMKQFMPVSAGTISGYGLGLNRYGAGGNALTWGNGGNVRGYTSCLLFSAADSIVVSISSNQPANGYILAWELLTTARQQLVTAAPDQVDGLRYALICFPNPAQRNGTIQYSLRKAQQVEITLQNSLGQTIKTLLSQHQEGGEHSLTVDTSTLPAGMYFCTLQTTNSKLVQRWVLAP